MLCMLRGTFGTSSIIMSGPQKYRQSILVQTYLILNNSSTFNTTRAQCPETRYINTLSLTKGSKHIDSSPVQSLLSWFFSVLRSFECSSLCVSSEVDSRKYQHLMIESMSLVCGDLGNVRLKGSRVFACFSPFTKTHLHHTVLSERFPKEYHDPITLPFLSSQTATVSDSFQFVSDTV